MKYILNIICFINEITSVKRCLPVVMLIINLHAVNLARAELVDSFTKEFSHGKDRIHISLIQKNFEPKNHLLDEKNWKIDNVTPYGVDGHEVHPEKELDEFNIKWNGNVIPMPEQMYKDCYSPDLKIAEISKNVHGELKQRKAPANYGVTVRWDDRNDMLQITMVSCKWVSAPYFVVWNISRYGVHSRRVVCLGS